MELLQCTATLPVGNGRWKSCNALPHCLGAVGSGYPIMHRHTALRQWAVELLQCTATLPRGSGQWNSCNAPPHRLGGSGQSNSCNARPHYRGAVGIGNLVMHHHTAWGQWAVELL